MEVMFAFLLPLAFALQTAKPFLMEVPGKYLQPAPQASQTVATVDGVEIKAKDVEDLLWQWRGNDAVRELVEYQIVKAEADKRGIKITPADVELKLNDTIKSFNDQQPGKDVDEALQTQGFTRSRAYLRLSRQVMLEKMALADFKPANYVEVSAITIKPGEGKTIEQAVAEAKTAYEKLQKGGKWKDVLASTTSDANIVGNEGRLGWRAMTIFPESTVAEMKPLKAGAYTKPVQTTSGVQIFRIEAKGDQIPSEKAEDLKQQYLAGAMAQLDKELHAKAKWTGYTPAKKH